MRADAVDLFFCLAMWVIPTAVLLAFHFAEVRRRQPGSAKGHR